MTYAAQPSAAPGRESPQAPAAPANTGEAQPPKGEPGAAGGGSGPFGGNSGMFLLMLLPLLLVFMMSRSQSKKQKQLESTLKVGDEVVTQSGIIGKIADLNERTARLEIAPGVKIQILKTTIQGLATVPEAKTEKTDAKDAQEKKA